MGTKPFITIITPTYNRGSIIEGTIQSVINQNKDIPFSWELLIIDDGSTDNTSQIVKKYVNTYPKNIFYFYQKNSGIPGAARNVGLENMNKNSDYTIFLDSDDELSPNLICSCLSKINEFGEKGKRILGLYFLCEDENHNVIGNRKILRGQTDIYFDYKSFLKQEINVELGIFIRSNIFIEHPKLRFSERYITEGIMWTQMWKYLESSNQYLYLWDYVGRIYKINHTSETRICKTISPKRFKDNAEGNEIILSMIKNDLDKYGYKKTESDFLFRIGINYILCGEKKKGLSYLKESIKTVPKITTLVLYILSFFSTKLVTLIYKIYIN